MPPRLPPRPGARRSVALIITLAILTILSTMLIGFVLSTREDRGATQNYGDSLRADQIALGGLDTVVASLRAEIASPGSSTNFISNSFTVSYPLSATNALIQRTVTNAVYPLVKVSGGTGYVSNGTAITNVPASAALTTSNSLNNRQINLLRWNRPQLVPAAGTNLFPVPKWVLLGRKGSFAPSGANPSAIGCAPGLASTNEVLGRYAYAVYDLGGLLDVNVAGYSGASGNRGLMPWADLSQVSGVSAFTAFPGLRNAANSSAAFAPYVTNAWAPAGFLTVAPGDTAFLSRQELIRYAASNGFTAALPYLTVFSRELNGPTWAPGQPAGSTITYTNIAAFTGSSGVTNFFLPSVRATTAFARTYVSNSPTLALNAVAGEPLLKYRFPLDKVSLLQAAAASPGANATAILGSFGLVQDTSTGAYKKWKYTNPAGGAAPNKINILSAISGREPDFFELLKATILSGSLGKIGRGDDYAGNAADPDAVSDNQIIQIGLNIIDQAGSDNLPTTVAFNGNEFYGVKDLPYISQVFITCVPDASPATVASSAYVFFNLWNPHQTTATSMPKLRLIPLDAGGNNYTLQYAVSATDTWTGTQNSNLSSASSITLSPAITDYRTPALLTTGSGGTTLSGNSANAFVLPATSALPSASTSSSGGTVWNAATAADPTKWTLLLKGANLSFALQYEYPVGTGTYHTYGVFAGKVTGATASSFPVMAGLTFNTSATALLLSSTANTSAGLANSAYFTKSDPRTTRWSASWDTTPFVVGASGNVLAGTNYKPSLLLPKVVSPAPSPYDLTQWCLNTGASAYLDNDGVKRPGDNALGGTGNDPFSSSATPASGNGRPLVLERPFASVGELGYAFRDLPWRSLDFSSALSADAGLLDAFTVAGGTVRRTVSGQLWETAGRISPNGLNYQPLAALLSGTQKNLVPATLSSSDAGTLAGALTNLTTTAPYALLSRANLADRFLGASTTVVPGTTVKTEREAVVRALAESSNTRTWNLLVDVIAQTGHYPATATTFDNFVVTGERRYWLHVAIDRYTGEIVDQQLEAVSD